MVKAVQERREKGWSLIQSSQKPGEGFSSVSCHCLRVALELEPTVCCGSVTAAERCWRKHWNKHLPWPMTCFFECNLSNMSLHLPCLSQMPFSGSLLVLISNTYLSLPPNFSFWTDSLPPPQTPAIPSALTHIST